MDRLWTPWRYDYVTRAEDSSRPGVPAALSAWSDSGAEDTHCVFCNMIAAVDYAIAHGMARDDAEKHAHLLVRGPSCFLCLNAFPYTTGHILIVPCRHLDSLAALPPGEARPQPRPGRRRGHRQPHPHARPAPLGRRHQLHDRHRQHPRPARGPGHHLGTHPPGLASLTAPASGCPIHRALCDGWVVRPGSPCLITVMFCLRARLPSLHKSPVLLKGTASAVP